MGIQRGCRIIQNENPRVSQYGACDSHPLLLATAEFNAILADFRLVAIRELHDKAMHVGGFGGRDDIGIRGILSPVTNILLERHGEEQRLLRNHPDMAAHAIQTDFSDIPTINPNHPLLHIIKACQQVDERGLPRSGWTNNRDDFSRLNAKVDIV